MQRYPYMAISDYCTITPTRGDRGQLFWFCLRQLDRMSEGRMNFVIDYKPRAESPDLVPRIQAGIELAKANGIEYVFIVEDDDWYPEDYLRTKTLDFDFFGYSSSTYYHLGNKTYQTMLHKNRSSLFCTGFRIAALDGFKWPARTTVFLDLELWDYAATKRKRVRLESHNPCLGMKHGIGLTGGKAHHWKMKNIDSRGEFLKQYVDTEALAFYNSLKW